MNSLFGRYVFRQVTNAFVIILLTLTTHRLARYSLETARSYRLPGTGLRAVPADDVLTPSEPHGADRPECDLMASLYTLDRMNGDSELIVMTAAGAPVWRIGVPFVLSRPPGLRGDPHLQSWSHAGEHARAAQPDHPGPHRRDLASPSAGPIFQPRAGPHLPHPRPLADGDLLGLLVHDERDDKQLMSYLADRGRIISNDEGAYLVMFDGHVHRYEPKVGIRARKSSPSTSTC